MLTIFPCETSLVKQLTEEVEGQQCQEIEADAIETGSHILYITKTLLKKIPVKLITYLLTYEMKFFEHFTLLY